MTGGDEDEEEGGERGARRLFDPGLQPERTELAWRRTALAVLAGSLGAARLLAERHGAAALLVGVAGPLLAALLRLTSARRAAATRAALLRDGDLRGGPGAALLAVTAGACALAGLAGLVVVLAAA